MANYGLAWLSLGFDSRGKTNGKHTDATAALTLPDHFKCPKNNISSLIKTIYPHIDQPAHLPDHYFAHRTILTSRNDDVDEINKVLLEQFPGQEREFLSADTIINHE